MPPPARATDRRRRTAEDGDLELHRDRAASLVGVEGPRDEREVVGKRRRCGPEPRLLPEALQQLGLHRHEDRFVGIAAANPLLSNGNRKLSA